MSKFFVKDAGAENFSLTLAWNPFAIFGCLSFSGSNRIRGCLREALGSQLQFNGCKHEVIIAANVGPWERSCVCFVDAGLEALGRQVEVYLVENLPIRSILGCSPRQLIGVKRVGKDGSLRTLGVSILCRLSLQCQNFLLSLPSVGMCQGLLYHSNRHELQAYPS